MESPKKQITARIPEVIYLGGVKKAEEKGLTFTDILIEALEKYLGDDLPGLCPSCHNQNDPESQYCQRCGTALTEDTTDPETISPYIKGWIAKQQSKQEALEKRIQEMDLEMRKVIRMTKILEKYKEEHEGKLE